MKEIHFLLSLAVRSADIIKDNTCCFSDYKVFCTTIHRYPIFSTRYSVIGKVYTGYCGTSETEPGLCACTVDNILAKARGLSLRTGAQTMLYLPLSHSEENAVIMGNFTNWTSLLTNELNSF